MTPFEKKDPKNHRNGKNLGINSLCTAPSVCVKCRIVLSNTTLELLQGATPAFACCRRVRITEYCESLYALAQKFRPADSQYLFTSFDERPLVEMRKHDADWPIAIIASKPLSDDFIERARRLRATHIACRIGGTTREMVQKAQKSGFKVNGWPGHRVEDYYLAIGLGLDVACTDIPTVIQQTREKLR